MWDPKDNMVSEAKNSATNLMEDKCGVCESTDSGFISSANLTHTSECFSEEIPAVPEEDKSVDSGLIDDGKEGYMKIDSGVDVCLSETFESLSLDPSLNNLNSAKTRTNEDLNTENIKHYPEETWKICYKQDIDGDT